MLWTSSKLIHKSTGQFKSRHEIRKSDHSTYLFFFITVLLWIQIPTEEQSWRNKRTVNTSLNVTNIHLHMNNVLKVRHTCEALTLPSRGGRRIEARLDWWDWWNAETMSLQRERMQSWCVWQVHISGLIATESELQIVFKGRHISFANLLLWLIWRTYCMLLKLKCLRTQAGAVLRATQDRSNLHSHQRRTFGVGCVICVLASYERL